MGFWKVNPQPPDLWPAGPAMAKAPPRGWLSLNDKLARDDSLAGYQARKQAVRASCHQRGCKRSCWIDIDFLVSRRMGAMAMSEFKRLLKCQVVCGCGLDSRGAEGCRPALKCSCPGWRQCDDQNQLSRVRPRQDGRARGDDRTLEGRQAGRWIDPAHRSFEQTQKALSQVLESFVGAGVPMARPAKAHTRSRRQGIRPPHAVMTVPFRS